MQVTIHLFLREDTLLWVQLPDWAALNSDDDLYLYSGCTRFESGPSYRQSWLKYLMVFLRILREMRFTSRPEPLRHKPSQFTIIFLFLS